MDKYQIKVTSAFGVEGLTKKELRVLGVNNPKAVDGSIDFEGTSLDIARLNMFLRTAERVYIQVGIFKASSFDELFENTASLDWDRYLDADGAFAVNGKSVKSALFSISSCQSIIKKAIINSLSKKTGKTIFAETGSQFNIEFVIRNDIVTLSINTSGKGLHKRGYRDFVGEAPIKETLACALIMLSDMKCDRPFIDPFCGSGTIVIEAARMALNIASGKGRDFDYCQWKNFDKNSYNLARQEALDLEKVQKLRFSGFDIDSDAVKLALRHAERAGVKDCIHIQAQDIKYLQSRYAQGVIVTNPPYGERLMDINSANALYKVFGKVYDKLENWSAHIITSAPQFEKYFGKRSNKNRKFFNANKTCHYYSYFQELIRNN